MSSDKPQEVLQMFKNKKMMRGIVLALAFVLVLGGGILLKLYANAASNTVVLYVSDEGDNTTGLDEASAFTTISGAMKAANNMQLSPGMELRVIVTDIITVETQSIDGTVVKDTAGGRVPVTITSLYDTSDEDMSTIYLTYRIAGANPLPTDGSQRAYVVNDVTFRNIRILAKVHGIYLNNEDTGLVKDLYRIRYFYLGGNKVVFDNCHLTSELGDFIQYTNSSGKDVSDPSWIIYGDTQTSNTNAADCSLTMKNRDYSHVQVYLNGGAGGTGVPNYDMTFYAENISLNNFFALRNTNTSTTDNAKSMNITVKNSTLSAFYLAGSGGDNGVTGGVNITIDGSVIKKLGGSSGAATVRADVTYNFINSEIQGHSDLLGYVFLAPRNVLYGNLTSNVVNTRFVTGSTDYKCTYGAVRVGTVNGDIHHNISGSSTEFYRFVGGGLDSSNTINGTVYTNFADGTVNELFIGGCYEGGTVRAIENTIQSGTFNAAIYGGSRKGTVSNNITNVITGGTFKSEWLYGGNNTANFGTPTEEIYYRIKNTLSGISLTRFVGGSASTPVIVNSAHGQYANGLIENHFGDGLKFSTAVYPGSTTNEVTDIRNFFDGAITASFVCGGSNNAPVGSIVNNIGSGAVLAEFDGANNSGGTVGSVVNVVEGTITSYYGGGRNTNVTVGSVTNHFVGGTVTSAAYGGCKDGTVDTIENDFSGTAFKAAIYAGSTKGKVNNCITNHIHGGSFAGDWFYGGNNNATFGTPTETISYRIKNEISNVTMKRFVGASYGSVVTGTDAQGTIENYYGGGLSFTTAAYSGSNDKAVSIIKNTFSGDIAGSFVCGGCNSGSVDSITNTVLPGAALPELCGGNNSGGTVGSVTNTVQGGSMTKFIGASRGNGTTGTVQNTISGGSFTGNVFLGSSKGATTTIVSEISGGSFTGTRLSPSCETYTGYTTATLDIKPDASSEPLIFGVPRGSGTYGLENKAKDVVTLYAASKPIRLLSDSCVNVDTILGNVTFLQTEAWSDGSFYVTADPATDSTLIHLTSTDNVTGSAAITTVTADVAPGTNLTRLAVVGDSTAPATVSVPATLTVDAMNFVLDDNLIVNFYTDSTKAAQYISAFGSFSYKVTFNGTVLTSGTITDLSSAPTVGSYVKIATNLGIPATRYGETIVVTLENQDTSYTVFGLLQTGITTVSGNPALTDLLKAIYNYGAEAEKLVGLSSATTYYPEITYTGSYGNVLSAESLVDGYQFTTASLSLGDQVYLNFYLNAASTDGLTFTAANAAGNALSSDRIRVIPFEGNSRYNLVITLRLSVASMADTMTLTVRSSDGTALATCTNSVTSTCATYIQQNNSYAPVSAALLAYVEKAQLV